MKRQRDCTVVVGSDLDETSSANCVPREARCTSADRRIDVTSASFSFKLPLTRLVTILLRLFMSWVEKEGGSFGFAFFSGGRTSAQRAFGFGKSLVATAQVPLFGLIPVMMPGIQLPL